MRLKPARKISAYEVIWDGVKYTGNIHEISKESGVSVEYLWYSASFPSKKRQVRIVGTYYPIFDYYRKVSMDYLDTGTTKEVSDRTGIKQQSLANTRTYYKEFKNEYRFVRSDEMIQRRSHDKHAPILRNKEYGQDTDKRTYTYKKAEKKEFKVSSYVQSLHDSFFAKWNLKEGQHENQDS